MHINTKKHNVYVYKLLFSIGSGLLGEYDDEWMLLGWFVSLPQYGIHLGKSHDFFPIWLFSYIWELKSLSYSDHVVF